MSDERTKSNTGNVLFGDAYSSGSVSDDGLENREFYLDTSDGGSNTVPRSYGSSSSVNYHQEQGGLPGQDVKGYETSTLDEIGDSKNHGVILPFLGVFETGTHTAIF